MTTLGVTHQSHNHMSHVIEKSVEGFRRIILYSILTYIDLKTNIWSFRVG